MTTASFTPLTESDKAEIIAGLHRILNSACLLQAKRRQRFLEYIVGEALAGRASQIKGYTIGVEVFDRPSTFDPLADPIVRVEAARLRDKLREYYDTEGRDDPVRIELPKGSYVPQFQLARAPETAPSAATADPAAAPSDIPAVANSNPETIAAPPAMPMSWQRAAAAGAAVLMAVVVGVLVLKGRPETPVVRDKASIAVLPFESFGGDATWRRFADGMTEDIVNDLSQSKDLFVVARNSTEIYRGKGVDVRAVGRDLGVNYVLVGSIQSGDTRIKVSTQLVDARTGGTVWSTRYHRPSADLFEVQRDVTEKIAATLIGYQGAVAQAERTLIRRKPPNHLSAYEYYLLGMEAKHGGASGAVTKPGLDEAERLFHRALEIDPQLARAYVGLAYIYEYRLELGLGGTPEENISQIDKVARFAVQLDPNDAEAQMVLGNSHSYHGLNEQALEQYARAESLAPSSADLAILIAWYMPQLDQPRRAAILADRALQLNPNYPVWYNQGLRYAYFFDRQFDKAVKYTRLVPAFTPADHAYLAAASAMTGDMATSSAAARELARADPTWSVEQYLSDCGGFPDGVASIYIEAANKAGIPACMTAERVAESSAYKRLNYCDGIRNRSVRG